ncbi:MAG: SCO family protein [Terricaulis sp.]
MMRATGKKDWRRRFAMIATGLLSALALVAWPSLTQAQSQSGWHRDYFPNVVLTDQNGQRHRFYDDMIHNKVVSINFIYTNCVNICPLDTASLRRVQEILGRRVGRDVHMYSISINPQNDTPATLTRFMRTYNVGPGWTFLTGSPADVALLQRRLGIRAPDPNNLGDHEASILLGNERTGQWIKRSSFENPQNLANILGEQLFNFSSRGPQNAPARQDYSAAGQVTNTSEGIYIFRTRCASCHTIGGGDILGPDLRGVTLTRDGAWLRRWISQPDRMIAERDPTAMSLLGRYRNLPMPNLRLGQQDVQAVIDYLHSQDVAGQPARTAPAAAPAPRRP